MSINNLPEEVLTLIFNLPLIQYEDKKYQYVCRAWYRPAHIKFLQRVSLHQISKVKKFIRSIDCNPDPSYLKAVKEVSVGGIYIPDPSFDKEALKKLFFRFPNLKRVATFFAAALLQDFDEELSQEFLKACPQNEIFVIDPCRDKNLYYEVLQKVRLLVTKIAKDSMPHSVNIADIITSFPRLNSIDGGSLRGIHTFGKYLPIIQKTTHLKHISLNNNWEEDEGFAERYLAAITKEEQDELVKKLSKVNTLNWNTGDFPLHSLKFIDNYLTGLNDVYIRIDMDASWTDHRAFCNTALDFLRSKHYYRLDISVRDLVLDEYDDDDEEAPSRLIAYLIQQAKIRVLQLTLTPEDWDTAIAFNSNKQEFMDIQADAQSHPPPMGLFSSKIPLVNIDEFTLDLQFIRRNDEEGIHFAFIEYYESILGALPSLKQATVDVPANFHLLELRSSLRNQKVVCLQLESLILRATPYGEFQPFLDKCLYMFPQLKDMNVYYHCGVWKENIGICKMELGGYSLERLTLDVTPIKMMIKKKFDKDQFKTDDFFVVGVKVPSNKKVHLYKASFDLSSVTKIVDNDLKEFTCGKDYLRVNISLDSLEQLELYMYRYGTPKEDNEVYLKLGKYATRIIIA